MDNALIAALIVALTSLVTSLALYVRSRTNNRKIKKIEQEIKNGGCNNGK
jgi:hypothetical protein